MEINPLTPQAGSAAGPPRALGRDTAEPGAYQWRQIEDADGLWRLFRARAGAARTGDGTCFDLAGYRVRIDRDDLRSDHFAIVSALAPDPQPVAYVRLVYPSAAIRSERAADLLRCCEVPLQHVDLHSAAWPLATSDAGWLAWQLADSGHRRDSVVEAQWLVQADEAPFSASSDQAWNLVRDMSIAANASHVVWWGELRELRRTGA